MKQLSFVLKFIAALSVIIVVYLIMLQIINLFATYVWFSDGEPGMFKIVLFTAIKEVVATAIAVLCGLMIAPQTRVSLLTISGVVLIFLIITSFIGVVNSDEEGITLTISISQAIGQLFGVMFGAGQSYEILVESKN